MPLLETSPNKAGNLIVREQWVEMNYCRADVRILLTITGAGAKPIQFGELVYSDSDTAVENYIRVGAGNTLPTNFKVAVVVDDRIGDGAYMRIQATEGFGEVPTTTLGNASTDWSESSINTAPLACIVRGDCVIREGGILFGGDVSEANRTALLAQLERQGIHIVPQMTGAFLEPRPFA